MNVYYFMTTALHFLVIDLSFRAGPKTKMTLTFIILLRNTAWYRCHQKQLDIRQGMCIDGNVIEQKVGPINTSITIFQHTTLLKWFIKGDMAHIEDYPNIKLIVFDDI